MSQDILSGTTQEVDFMGAARDQVVAIAPVLFPVRGSALEMLGGISHATLGREVKAGKLHITKIGSRSFLTDVEINRYVQSLGVAS